MPFIFVPQFRHYQHKKFLFLFAMRQIFSSNNKLERSKSKIGKQKAELKKRDRDYRTDRRTITITLEPIAAIDTPIYLTARDIMTKTSVFVRINTTRSNILTIGKVLEKNGFMLTKSNEKRLCEVFGISLEEVKAHFSRPEQGKEELNEKGKDIANGQGINSDQRLPL